MSINGILCIRWMSNTDIDHALRDDSGGESVVDSELEIKHIEIVINNGCLFILNMN